MYTHVGVRVCERSMTCEGNVGLALFLLCPSLGRIVMMQESILSTLEENVVPHARALLVIRMGSLGGAASPLLPRVLLHWQTGAVGSEGLGRLQPLQLILEC